ncbi:hypothetical protein PMI25_004451 [Pseudomonas sp. GM30]|nr:hypothetical protein PMI25_004451 [Pseudomonas sp. GM30]
MSSIDRQELSGKTASQSGGAVIGSESQRIRGLAWDGR